MTSPGKALIFILLLTLFVNTLSRPLINLFPPEFGLSGHLGFRRDDGIYCDSWRFSVETNDVGPWITIPLRCLKFVTEYFSGVKYMSDSEVVSQDSFKFAKTVNVSGDGKDAWVFDIDETLLSNLPYYQDHGLGYEKFNETTFDEWVDLAKAPALPASLQLYKELKTMGFKIFLLTGRIESQRNVTEKNLLFTGYRNWERLIMRGASDIGIKATVYKSNKRKEIEGEGYRIHGSSGDQWSDLLGFSVAKRSFKLPNILYYIA